MAQRTIRISAMLLFVFVLFAFADAYEWTVESPSGNCMLITIEDAVVANPVFDVETSIPASAEVTSPSNSLSSCPEGDIFFQLSWSDQGYDWNLGFQFTINEKKDRYSLDRVNTTCTEASGKDWTTSLSEWTYMTVPVGKAMTCTNFVTGTTRIMKYRFQPYANAAGGNYGTGECHSWIKPKYLYGIGKTYDVTCDYGISGVSTAFIVVFVFLCIFVVLVVFTEVQDR